MKLERLTTTDENYKAEEFAIDKLCWTAGEKRAWTALPTSFLKLCDNT
jgi:hypothetical protein